MRSTFEEEERRKSQNEEEILFLTSVPLLSSTLSPSPLQTLQYKSFTTYTTQDTGRECSSSPPSSKNLLFQLFPSVLPSMPLFDLPLNSKCISLSLFHLLKRTAAHLRTDWTCKRSQELSLSFGLINSEFNYENTHFQFSYKIQHAPFITHLPSVALATLE